MKYDFDTPVDRRGSNSVKWDDSLDPDILPMWVADMDFRTLPNIVEAIKKRADHGIFGYTSVPDRYYECIIEYYRKYHGFEFKKEHMLYTIGVVPALSICVKSICTPDDCVIIQTPVYNCFFSSIKNHEINAVHNPLVREGDTYRMDLEDLRAKIEVHRPKFLLLCNPHNPVGRVWRREELEALGRICNDNNIMVVTDEIHNEITHKPNKYVPYGSISQEFFEKSITLFSPSKAFNLASLQMASIVCCDPKVRHIIKRAIHINEISDVNPFGILAAIEAYTNGRDYLDQMLEYIYSNYLLAKEFIEKNMPEVGTTKLEGTYMMFLDCSCFGMDSMELNSRLIKEVKLRFSPGGIYGPEGNRFMRMNLATQRSRVQEGLNRFHAFYKSFFENQGK